MFTLAKQKVRLTHVNLREEKHGPDETVLAVDLSFQADVSNNFLSELSPTLKWSLYEKSPNEDLADKDKTHMPVLRYSQLGELDWASKMENATVVLHGKSKAETIEFAAAVNKLVLVPKEGGTVAIKFRVQTPVTPDQAGALSGLLSREIKMSIAPAEIMQTAAEE